MALHESVPHRLVKRQMFLQPDMVGDDIDDVAQRAACFFDHRADILPGLGELRLVVTDHPFRPIAPHLPSNEQEPARAHGRRIAEAVHREAHGRRHHRGHGLPAPSKPPCSAAAAPQSLKTSEAGTSPRAIMPCQTPQASTKFGMEPGNMA